MGGGEPSMAGGDHRMARGEPSMARGEPSRPVESLQVARGERIDGLWRVTDGRLRAIDGLWRVIDGRLRAIDGLWRVIDGRRRAIDGLWERSVGRRKPSRVRNTLGLVSVYVVRGASGLAKDTGFRWPLSDPGQHGRGPSGRQDLLASSSPRRQSPAQCPVCECGASSCLDCGESACRRKIDSRTSARIARNSLCQFWNDWYQNSALVR